MGWKQIFSASRFHHTFPAPDQRDSNVLDEIQEESQVGNSYSQAESKFCRRHIRIDNTDDTAGPELVIHRASDLCLLHCDEHRHSTDIQ